MRTMTVYPVACCGECGAMAAFKIAAQWSDGPTQELKTYFLSCQSCLVNLFPKATAKQRACRLAPGETLAPPGVYELSRGAGDRSLVRRGDLE